MVTHRTKLMQRSVSVRDARLYIVATEGACTEPEYINWLKEQGWIDRTRVHVEVVSTVEGRSSPRDVLGRLDEAKKRIKTIEGDECWLLIDVDKWTMEMLSDVTQQAEQKGFHLGVSNPCFEAWLLLHFTDSLPRATQCSAFVKELRARLGGFSKSSSNFEAYTRERVAEAIDRARRLDTGGRWPQPPPGTHAYRLFDTLFRV